MVRSRYVSLSSLPVPKTEYAVNLNKLDGGLNLWDLDYHMAPNQSPDMLNLWWKDGVLGSRPGQAWVSEDATRGTGYACYERLFWDCAFFHLGSKLYYLNPCDHAAALVELCGGVPECRGTFFRYGDHLFYKNKGAYIQISYDPNCTPVFAADTVTAYAPVTFINTDPTTHAGDSYEPENRLSARKTVWYNAAPGITKYCLPVTDAESVDLVVVDGVAKTLGTDYTVDLTAGTVTFAAAPPVTNPATNNTVKITYSKADTDGYNSIMNCSYAAVYGGDTDLCIVLSGCPAQPNAYFWNANSRFAMNPGYFPYEYYNLAGDTEDPITGFGRQASYLVIFKERSIGRTTAGTKEINSRAYISMNYTAINSKIGCDLSWSIQLVENNLVFCNTAQGVHMILSSSPAYENNIICISRNVNGTDTKPGLLAAVRGKDRDLICSADDGNCYWLAAGEKVFVWDYVLSSSLSPSWFYFENVAAKAFFHTAEDLYHLDTAGRVTKFYEQFTDYGTAIKKRYQFTTQNFGNYDRLKDITGVTFVTRSDTATTIKVTYKTDYEMRVDLADIRGYSWRLSARNLAYRYLGVKLFANVERRLPGCKNIRHFTMILENDIDRSDMSLVSAQIFYKFKGRDK